MNSYEFCSIDFSLTKWVFLLVDYKSPKFIISLVPLLDIE